MTAQHKSGKCSVCGSENIEYGYSEPDGESLFYEVTCKDCHATGKEWYNLQYVETNMERYAEGK